MSQYFLIFSLKVFETSAVASTLSCSNKAQCKEWILHLNNSRTLLTINCYSEIKEDKRVEKKIIYDSKSKDDRLLDIYLPKVQFTQRNPQLTDIHSATSTSTIKSIFKISSTCIQQPPNRILCIHTQTKQIIASSESCDFESMVERNKNKEVKTQKRNRGITCEEREPSYWWDCSRRSDWRWLGLKMMSKWSRS